MCGIAGYIGRTDLDDGAIERTLRSMHHRGPDDRGIYRARTPDGGAVCLLHTRLCIMDLDARSRQPMRLGPKVLACNGELYNYRELRCAGGWNGELRTDGDTEILLRVLARDGWQGLDVCEGMWAFALYDEDDGSLLLGRDRFGEKPLYLLETDAGTWFGSEIKLLTALSGRRLDVDEHAVRRYLVNGYRSLHKADATFFRGVRTLPAGGVLRLDAGGGRRPARYWTPRFEPDEGLDYEQVVSSVRSRLIRSVELRLRADVPVAFLLSGGVDSNALVGIARRALGHEAHGFTIVSRDARYDERDAVKRSVADLGIRHTAIELEPHDFPERLRQLVRQHDGPVSTLTFYVQSLLMRHLADAGYRVSIAGTGADELFSGYYDHHLAYLYEIRDDPDLHAAALADWGAHIRPVVRNPWLSDADLFIRDPGFRDHLYFDAEVFGGFLRDAAPMPFEERRYAPGLLRNRMANELLHETVPTVLHEDDLNAMEHSVENRTPFLDRELFDLAQRIPTRYLVRGGFAKAVLRDATRGLAPDSVLDQHAKVGFNVPLEELLDLGSAEGRAALLDDGPIYDLVRRDAIEALLEEPGLANSRSKFLFSLLNSRFFLEEFAA